MIPTNNINRENIQNKKSIVDIINLLKYINALVLNQITMVRPEWHI